MDANGPAAVPSGSFRSRRRRPSAQEMAAIVAAVELLWPKPLPPPPPTPPAGRAAWRWSGRWWGPRHLVADRRRPW